MRTNTGRIGASIAVSLALILPALVGCSAVSGAGAAAPAQPAASSVAPAPAPPKPAVPEVPTADASIGSLASAAVITPVRIALPDLSIDMTVEPEGLDRNGAMALPENAADAGWYRFGPGLQAAAGATVIAAHIDSRHDGIGPFSRLKDAAVGSLVTLTADTGATVAYTVSDVRAVGKIDAPMAEVFDRSGSPRLTLVTCGGAFDYDTGHYLDNVIVTAIPVAE